MNRKIILIILVFLLFCSLEAKRRKFSGGRGGRSQAIGKTFRNAGSQLAKGLQDYYKG